MSATTHVTPENAADHLKAARLLAVKCGGQIEHAIHLISELGIALDGLPELRETMRTAATTLGREARRIHVPGQCDSR